MKGRITYGHKRRMIEHTRRDQKQKIKEYDQLFSDYWGQNDELNSQIRSLKLQRYCLVGVGIFLTMLIFI